MMPSKLEIQIAGVLAAIAALAFAAHYLPVEALIAIVPVQFLLGCALGRLTFRMFHSKDED
jgi:hypothetical protein